MNDEHRNFAQMASENGYASEQYTIVTEDGYVSQLYRLPGKIDEVGAGAGR